MVSVNKTVIEGALTKAQAAIKEYANVGGRNLSKEVSSTESVTVRARGAWQGIVAKKRELIEVEQYANKQHPDMVTARDSFVSTTGGRRIKRLYESQFMSETGEAFAVPPKKGFLGIGKSKGHIEVTQSPTRAECFRNVTGLEEMVLKAEGTFENPENCVLHIGQKRISITPEQAKEFMADVKAGKRVYSFEYLTADTEGCLNRIHK